MLRNFAAVISFGAIIAVLLALSTIDSRAGSAPFTQINLPVRSQYTATTDTVTSVSSVILSQNALRNYLLIQNKAAASTIYCKAEGTAPTATTADVEIIAGGNWEPPVIPIDAVACVAASGNNWVVTVEGAMY